MYDCVETFHKVIRSMSGGTKLPFGKTASNSLLGSSPRPMALKITNLLNLKWKSHNFLLPVQPGELSSHVWFPVFPRLLWELRHLLLFPSCSWQHFAFLVNMRWRCWPCGVCCHCPWSYENINWLGAHMTIWSTVNSFNVRNSCPGKINWDLHILNHSKGQVWFLIKWHITNSGNINRCYC